MATYRISESERINVIICRKSEEFAYSLHSCECLVTAIAIKLSLDPQQITVSFEDNYIEFGLTPLDCGIVENSRLTVTITKKIHVDEAFQYLLRDGCLCRSNACGGYVPPLGTLSKYVISCRLNNTEQNRYVGVDVFTGDKINNKAPYVKYYNSHSAGSGGLSLGTPNIMDFENDINLRTFLENIKGLNVSKESWESRYELIPV